jgi:hypothetical protein
MSVQRSNSHHIGGSEDAATVLVLPSFIYVYLMTAVDILEFMQRSVEPTEAIGD